MAGRRTNLALLTMLGVALGTGFAAFAAGPSWGLWVVAAHGAVGLGLMLLLPWKSVIVRRGFRHRRPGWLSSFIFTVLVAANGLIGLGEAGIG